MEKWKFFYIYIFFTFQWIRFSKCTGSLDSQGRKHWDDYILRAPNRRLRCLGILSVCRWCGRLGEGNTLSQISIAGPNPWRDRLCPCAGPPLPREWLAVTLIENATWANCAFCPRPQLRRRLMTYFVSFKGGGGRGAMGFVSKARLSRAPLLPLRSGNLRRSCTPRSMQHFTYLPPVPTWSVPPSVIRQCRHAGMLMTLQRELSFITSGSLCAAPLSNETYVRN